MMIVRAALAAALATGVLAASSVTGQPKSARVGMLRTIDDPSSAGPLAANLAAFKRGLAEDGYGESRNLAIE